MDRISNKLKAYMEDLSANNHFNGNVLVAKGDKILIQDAYGKSSFQYDVDLNIHSKFRIGSLTKAFTAMSILLLSEKGLLKLHDPISGFFPNYKYNEEITIHQLLTNTSGLDNFTASNDYWSSFMRKPHSITEIVDNAFKKPLNFTPGEKFDYSNTGYLALTCIIEKVSGKFYKDFVREHILDNLSMSDTGIDNGRNIVGDLATGHTVWEKVINIDYVDMSFPTGAYGMYSTIHDLYKWSQSLRDASLINDFSQRNMFSGYEKGYGYGWFVKEDMGLVYHFGDINGFVSHFTLDRFNEITVIILSNINITPVKDISNDLLSIVNEQKQPKLLTKLWETSSYAVHLVGLYKSDENEIEIIYDGDLFAVVPKMYGIPYKLRLYSVSENIFVSDFIREYFTFVNGDMLIYSDSEGKSRKLKKYRGRNKGE